MTPHEVERRVKAWLANGGQEKFTAAMGQAEQSGERFIRSTGNIDWAWRASL